MSRVVIRADGCWEWTGGTTGGAGRRAPYGVFWLDGSKITAHRGSWLIFRGPIPERHHIDHLCRMALCVNPDHLEPVLPRENLRRVYAADPCPNCGHQPSMST